MQLDTSGEKQIAEFLATHHQGKIIETRSDDRYDCKILAKSQFLTNRFFPITYEIKCDWKSRETHNLYFEIKNTYRRKPSGLATSKADSYAHYAADREQLLLYHPAAMLWFLKTRQYTKMANQIWLSKEHSGDKNSQGYLAKIDTILTWPHVRAMPCSIVAPSL